MKKAPIALVAVLSVAAPLAAFGQDARKAVKEERAAADAAEKVEREARPADVRSAWSAWLEANPDRVAAGEAPAQALLTLRQTAGGTLDEIDDYVDPARDDDGTLCAQRAEEVRAERTSLEDELDPTPVRITDLDDSAAAFDDLADALEACRSELAATVDRAVGEGGEIRPGKPGSERVIVSSDDGEAGVESEAGPVPSAAVVNEIVDRMKAIRTWTERLRTLSKMAGDLHDSTDEAIRAAEAG